MKRIFSGVILLGLLACLLSACGGGQAAQQSAGPGHQLLTDCVGRVVEVPERPARVVALDSFAGEAMVMIGAGDRMIAAPNGVKSDVFLQQMCPTLADTSSPMSGGTINGETLAQLEPDLVLLKEAMYGAEGEREKLEKLNIPYLVIGYDSMEEQIQMLELIGTALGGTAQETAARMSGYYRSVVQRVSGLAAEIPAEERVRVYHSISEAVRTDGADTLGSDWIACVGAIDVSADTELTFAENDYFASMEQIYSWNPEVIICNEADTTDYFLTDEKWSGLDAVGTRQVYTIPVGATRWGHRGSLETFFAMLWLGKTLYPQVYRDVDLKGEVTAFYQTYLGISLEDAQYEAILSGNGIRVKSAGGNG